MGGGTYQALDAPFGSRGPSFRVAPRVGASVTLSDTFASERRAAYVARRVQIGKIWRKVEAKEPVGARELLEG
jgi:hypothetical protein